MAPTCTVAIAMMTAVRFLRPVRPGRSVRFVAPSRPDAPGVGVRVERRVLVPTIVVWVEVLSGYKLLHHAALSDTPIAQYDKPNNFGRIGRRTGRWFRRRLQRRCWRFVIVGVTEIAQQCRPGQDTETRPAELLDIGRHNATAVETYDAMELSPEL